LGEIHDSNEGLYKNLTSGDEEFRDSTNQKKPIPDVKRALERDRKYEWCIS
jgi:hypothetical protein